MSEEEIMHGLYHKSKKRSEREETVQLSLFWDKYGTFFILAIIVAIFVRCRQNIF